MASLRLTVVLVTPDALATSNIRRVLQASVVNMWATAVDLADEIALFLDNTEIMASGRANVAAAALGMIDTGRDQLVFDTVVFPGDLRVPVGAVTASLIFLLSVEPVL